MDIRGAVKRWPRWVKVLSAVILVPVFLLTGLYLSIAVSFWPDDYFWVEREDAVMPVWVEGNIDSGVFVVFNHGGPGSVGTLESIIEVSPGNGQMGNESPIKVLEEQYAVVYWDQRHSGMSKGSADPNDSTPDSFGEDLALVVDELDARYDIQSLFLIGQSWGHTVATSYLANLEEWADNQARVDGYIAYKGNQELQQAYVVARERILVHAQEQVTNGVDVEYWQEAEEFYEQRPVITEATDFMHHIEYTYGVMDSSISLMSRIMNSVRASLFSPFNGLRLAPNNSKTVQAEEFMSYIVSDTSLTDVIPRIEVPTLLVYGRNDLVAPVEVGEFIYTEIGTSDADKELVVLEQSRHGAEDEDVAKFQAAIVRFIEEYR
ncbi:MAG: alpha/beta hydrolase [Acidimicrobiia bacterium]|nr:alpha/beta hydrolase [Acidimicrobiia bacterium]